MLMQTNCWQFNLSVDAHNRKSIPMFILQTYTTLRSHVSNPKNIWNFVEILNITKKNKVKFYVTYVWDPSCPYPIQHTSVFLYLPRPEWNKLFFYLVYRIAYGDYLSHKDYATEHIV